MDTARTPPRVAKLHYVFDGWLGDQLLETFPCFIVTDTVARRLLEINATGFSLRPMKTSKSPTFAELHPDLELPSFHWLDVTGMPGKDDFGLAADGRLVVCNRILLQDLGLDHALIDNFPANT